MQLLAEQLLGQQLIFKKGCHLALRLLGLHCEASAGHLDYVAFITHVSYSALQLLSQQLRVNGAVAWSCARLG